MVVVFNFILRLSKQLVLEQDNQGRKEETREENSIKNECCEKPTHHTSTPAAGNISGSRWGEQRKV